MAITFDNLENRRSIYILNELVSKHNWHIYKLNMPTVDQLRDMIQWCHTTLEPRFEVLDDLDLAQFSRWSSTHIKNQQGLVDCYLFAFRDEADLTLFTLKWA